MNETNVRFAKLKFQWKEGQEFLCSKSNVYLVHRSAALGARYMGQKSLQLCNRESLCGAFFWKKAEKWEFFWKSCSLCSYATEKVYVGHFFLKKKLKYDNFWKSCSLCSYATEKVYAVHSFKKKAKIWEFVEKVALSDPMQRRFIQIANFWRFSKWRKSSRFLLLYSTNRLREWI